MGRSLALTPILDRLLSIIVYPNPGLGPKLDWESSFLIYPEPLSGPLIQWVGVGYLDQKAKAQ